MMRLPRHERRLETPKNGISLIANPPFSKGRETQFLKALLKQIHKKGKLAIVLPGGVLFRRQERIIRKKVIDEDLLEAVVAMPPKLFSGTGIPVHLLFFNRRKAPGRKNKFLFIYAAEAFTRGRQINILEPDHIKQIIRTFREYKTQKGYSRIVPKAEIVKNDYNLNIPRYITPLSMIPKPIDMEKTIREMKEAQKEARKAEKQMWKTLKRMGYG